METVRRNKFCLYLRERESNKTLKSKSKTDVNDQERGVVTCSYDPNVCHPYEGRINVPHAMADVLRTAFDLFFFLDWELSLTFHPSVPEKVHKVISRRFSDPSTIITKLTHEVYFADRNRAWCRELEKYPTRFSQLEGNRTREVPDCGNYIDHAHHLAEMADRSVARSIGKMEKQAHLKKLEFYQAMCKMNEIKQKYKIRWD